MVGDEAIAISYEARAPSLGQGIGINLRRAEYSGLTDDVITTVRDCLGTSAAKYSTSLLPIPISMHGPSDCESIRQLLATYDPVSDGGESLDDLSKLLAQVSRCRIVVTGSYHAAVFALSQGIPVVALARSHHYLSKMSELAAAFDAGCQVVSFATHEWAPDLVLAIDAAWRSADQCRPELLLNAQRQIALNEGVYRTLADLVG